MSARFDFLVYIGRFQPFHNGHLGVLLHALEIANHVVVVLGSARRARNIKNPFADDERRQMLLDALRDVDRSLVDRVTVGGVRDYYDNAKWVPAIKSEVARAIGADAAGIIGIIGHNKDRSSYYLAEFPQWRLIEAPDRTGISATDLRTEIFSKRPDEWANIARRVPGPVLRALHQFAATPAYVDLSEEYRTILAGNRAWVSAPFPPIFVTVDAVLRARGHVLMIERKHAPGKGQWALPGGFLNPHERLLDAALRELFEETEIDLPRDVIRQAYRDREVFDHPDRSIRGCTVTHAFFFDLGDAPLPAVAGADDALTAQWVPVDALPQRETRVFEDHLHIVARFVENVL